MLAYTLFGTNDSTKAREFYNALLSSFNMKIALENERISLWAGEAGAMLGVCIPADNQEATHGNGTMIALRSNSTDEVDKAFDYALTLGATQSGVLSELKNEDDILFYGKYVRDLDGNRICFFYSTMMP